MKVDMKKVSRDFDDYDRSYPSEEKSLFMRLSDLFLRLDDSDDDKKITDPLFFGDEDLRYALPKEIQGKKYIQKAIDLVKEKLLTFYDVIADDYIIGKYESNEMPEFEQTVLLGFQTAA